MRINQNIMAFNAFRNLTATNNDLGKSLEKLSSGFRINRAADDAAGLVVSEGLRAQVSGLKVAVRNAQDGTSVVQTAEGALTEVHSMLRRMRDLSLQARNTGANDADARAAAQAEIDQLASEIDRVAETTKFGSVTLLDGNYGAVATTSGVLDGTDRTAIDALAAGAGEFTLSIAGGANALVDIGGGALLDGTPTAAEFEAGLATRVRNALTTAGYTTEQVEAFQVNVSDADGDGAWTVEFRSDQAFTTVDTDAGTLALLGLTANTFSVSGTGGVFQVGANAGAGERINVQIDAMDAGTLGVDSLNLESAADAAITALDNAISLVSEQRGKLGAIQNRFEHTIANLSVTQENLAASESRIRDTDMALELVTFTRNQILQQAGTAMLAQANQVPQSVLSLLR